MNSLETSFKMSYLTQKKMKKMQGKLTAYEIALGRNIIKMIRKNYGE